MNARPTPSENSPAKRSATLTLLGILASQVGSDAISLRVINLGRAEQRGLRFNLRAVADDHNLRVGRIEIFPRPIEHVRRREFQDALAISFQIIVWQFFERRRGELPGEAVLRREAQRKYSGQIVARVV